MAQDILPALRFVLPDPLELEEQQELAVLEPFLRPTTVSLDSLLQYAEDEQAAAAAKILTSKLPEGFVVEAATILSHLSEEALHLAIAHCMVRRGRGGKAPESPPAEDKPGSKRTISNRRSSMLTVIRRKLYVLANIFFSTAPAAGGAAAAAAAGLVAPPPIPTADRRVRRRAGEHMPQSQPQPLLQQQQQPQPQLQQCAPSAQQQLLQLHLTQLHGSSSDSGLPFAAHGPQLFPGDISSTGLLLSAGTQSFNGLSRSASLSTCSTSWGGGGNMPAGAGAFAEGLDHSGFMEPWGLDPGGSLHTMAGSVPEWSGTSLALGLPVCVATQAVWPGAYQAPALPLGGGQQVQQQYTADALLAPFPAPGGPTLGWGHEAAAGVPLGVPPAPVSVFDPAFQSSAVPHSAAPQPNSNFAVTPSAAELMVLQQQQQQQVVMPQQQGTVNMQHLLDAQQMRMCAVQQQPEKQPPQQLQAAPSSEDEELLNFLLESFPIQVAAWEN